MKLSGVATHHIIVLVGIGISRDFTPSRHSSITIVRLTGDPLVAVSMTSALSAVARGHGRSVVIHLDRAFPSLATCRRPALLKIRDDTRHGSVIDGLVGPASALLLAHRLG